MHELALAQEVIRIIEKAARDQAFSRVRTVRLEIGRFAAAEPEALRFCFDVAAREGVAGGARLEILELPGAGWCPGCADTVPLESAWDACPRCGGRQVRVTGGTEMRVKELEVD